MQKLTVAVIGGTGKIGSVLVKYLVNKGYKLKLLVRSPEKVRLPQVLLVKGDARNPDAVNELVRDCDLLINCIGQTKGEPPLFSQVAKNIMNALNSRGIKRYIVIAGLGLRTESDKKRFVTRFLTSVMHFVFPAIMDDKKREYKLIAGSSLDWTYIRIPKVDHSSDIDSIVANESDCLSWKINVFGLAEFIESQIESREYIRKAPFVYNHP